ncbi:hypothetical protein KEM52_003590 [Ascosphaera acerosa]|nr:hypothetical protein KEM52_003590 [Ascosphaera acerosa]
MAAGTCSVCKERSAKYKCPVDGVATCSVACIKRHKGTDCAPSTADATDSGSTTAETTAVLSQTAKATSGTQSPTGEVPDLATLAASQELQALFKKSPSLRSGLRSIYELTLEENWVESTRVRDFSRRGHRGRGGLQMRRLGRWTDEKGFKRGLGKVKKITSGEDRYHSMDEAAFGEFVRLALGGQALPDR